MSFRFGTLVSGPEHRASWAADVLRRVTDPLAGRPAGPGGILLRHHIGESLGERAWTGLGKPSQQKYAVSFHIGMPLAGSL